MPNEEGSGYFRFSMSTGDWARLRKKGFDQLSDRGRVAVADSLYAAFSRGAVEIDALLPWLPRFVDSPLRQVATRPMSVLRFIMYDAASPEHRGAAATYAAGLYRKRYRRLGWRAKAGDSSDTKLLREAVLRFLVMDVRDQQARARAARLGRAYAGYRGGQAAAGTVDAQLARLVLAAAVQESDARFFNHLLGQLDPGLDAASRGRILGALAHAESPALSERALDLALDEAVRINEISRLLATQLRNPRTRERAWSWLTDNFDALIARTGRAHGGRFPWYAGWFCTMHDAEAVRAFFAPRVSTLTGGPRNLEGAVEAIELCANKAQAHRPGVDRVFAVRSP